MDPTAFSPTDTQALIDYARRKFAEERFPLSPALRDVREALAKLSPKPAPLPPAAKPFLASTVMRKKARRRSEI